MILDHKYKIITGLILVSALWTAVYAQKLTLRNYLPENGLPHLMNTRIYQDASGFIWFCSSVGLTRYDGDEYLTYGKTDGFPGNGFIQLSEDSRGNLWALLSNGLAAFQVSSDGQILKLDKWDHRNGLPDERWTAFLLDEDRGVWLGSQDNGLYYMKRDTSGSLRFQMRLHVGLDQGLPGDWVRSVFRDNRGQLWIATDGGLAVIRWIDQNREMYRLFVLTPRDGLSSTSVYSIVQDLSDVIWVATEKGLARMIDVVESSGKNKFRNYTESDGLPDNRIVDLSLDRIGHLWMATPRGLARFFIGERRSDQSFSHITSYNRQQGFTEDHLTSIFIDRQNIVWMTTASGAVSKLVSERFQTFTTDEGLPEKDIGPLLETGEGIILAGTTGTVAWIRPLNDQRGNFRVKIETITLPRSGGILQDLVIQPDGKALAVTERALWSISGRHVNPVAMPAELQNRTLKTLVYDHSGQRWIGTSSGLYGLRNKKTLHYNRKNGLINETIRALFLDSYGQIWIGTQDGLAFIRKEELSKEQPRLQMMDHPELNGKPVIHLFEDRLRDLWVSTDAGLVRLLRNNTDQVQKVIAVDMTTAGFIHSTALSMTQDATGLLWILTRRGIHLFDPDNLKVRRIWMKKDGLAGQEGSSPKGILRARDGSLWIGLNGGLTRYLPRVDFEVDAKTKIILKKFFANNERRPLNQDLRLPYTTKQISVEYTALDFTAEDHLQYQVILEGHDAGWSDPSTQRKARFTNLSGGAYRLKICVFDPTVPPLQAPTLMLPVTIETHPLRQWWFYGITLALVSGVVYLLYQRRMNLIRRRQQDLEMTIHLRMQELRNQNEQIRRQQVALEQQKKQLELTIKQLTRTQNDLIHSKKMASLVQIVAGIAHELNNPLSNVSGNMHLLKEYLDSLRRLLEAYERFFQTDTAIPEKMLEDIRRLKNEIDYEFLIFDLDHMTSSMINGLNRLIRIVENLRRFSRLDEAECKEFDVNESIRNVIDLFINQYRFSLKIETHLNPVPMIHGYPQELNQAILQILLNAAQAILALREKPTDEQIPPERGGINIETAVVYLEKWSDFSASADPMTEQTVRVPVVQIRIRDDGIGIQDEHKEKIFDPFFTTRKIGEGTGLGLSVAYSIIEKHNGKIFFNSRYGEGTEFIIELPMSADEEAQDPANA